MNAAVATPRVGENERLGATLALSLILHGIVVLGLGFALDDAAPVVPTLDVILSQTQTPLTPKEADFLAAANQQGGGDHDKAQRPRDNQAGWVPQQETGLAPQPLRAQSPSSVPPPQARVITAPDSDILVPPAETRPQPDQPELPTGEQKVQRDAEMARLAAEIHLRSELYAKRPKRKFVSASTREYEYANYLRAWVDRAERVGNLNYPDEARRKRLTGQLVISVAVRRDGSVEGSRIIRSSGIPLLDSTALRIVTLAEPFPPLPQTEENVDVLHVTRTWNFLAGGEVRDE
ncbi:energy transducer TonB [Pseudoxanthomonas wuyuanensis]|uniref:Outer membrane transport energization protein TonB n=1 Tax=Pseudoxanthomonas wuyuanensis TaxID=1073196 RepID=A0A286D7X2_9GAMM|nr:energy transducer TonB [Pseudoxanthomonas wuyuanensis]KAF1720352.1 energy transducer TonB [Pseudoxanthomonas wuyuanensis]SOD54724.1 outer membrane transport energization protein TonB [Pseudoxanthomonas wuyuanensis]